MSRRVAIPLDDGSVAHATMTGRGPDSPATLRAIKAIAEAAQQKFTCDAPKRIQLRRTKGSDP